jgi:hypothetical protein
LKIDGLDSGDYQLMIFSTAGRLLFEGAIHAGHEKVEIKTSSLSAGIYMVQLLGKEISLTKKVFIK